MAKTMQEVLAEHEMDYTYDGKQTGCSCGHWQARGPVSAHADHAAHQAAALSAAGYGLVADAKREAFDYGWREGNGWPTPVNIETGELLHEQARPAPFNPYREASNDDS